MTPADEQRLLSMIFNYSWWEWWTTFLWKVGDFGISDDMTPNQAIAYRERIRRFPRCIPHKLGDFCDRQNRLFHEEWSRRPMTEWPRNRRTK